MANSIMDFIEENYKELLAFAVRLNGSLEDGEDVFQAVAAKICQKQNELKDLTVCKTYLMTCIRNATLNFQRAKARQYRADTGFETLKECMPDPKAKEAFAVADWVGSLEQHLMHYEEPLRKAFIAYYVDQTPLEEVAASLGLSKRQTTKKFESMRTYLKRHYKHLFMELCVLLSI